jgi:8-oxo-dGTP pyrophosphatase MutT (NUDIX family)
MIKTEFMTLYEELSEIQEAKTSRPFPQGYVEAAESINLGDCRMIASDVMDMRGELEESACLEYKGVLTRVAASVLPFRDGPEGKEVFLKLWRSAVYLLGGGVDLKKDGTEPTRTVARESFEECNMNLSNIKDSGCSYWEYSEKPWVERHVANPEDRWNGYYTWLFTADYTGEGDNEFPEEGDNFRWHKVSDILARPDTKKLKFIKQAIIQGGYAEAPVLEEDITLTEGKQLGYVSYAVRKSAVAQGHPISSLLKIMESGYIKASTEEDGSKYVSLSRDLLGHLGAGSDWKCGLVLDGDKLANRYKVKPVDYNSMVYFGEGSSAKQLMLRQIAKYQALDEQGQVTDRTFYTVSMQGCGFVTTISKDTYEVLKTLMEAHNSQLAVSDTGRAKPENKGKTNKELKKYFDIKHTGALPRSNTTQWKQFVDSTEQDLPSWLIDSDKKPAAVTTGTIMQAHRVPKKYADATWLCTECSGYNTQNSDLVLKASKLGQYKDLIISNHGIDITSQKFFSELGGSYIDEAEERVEAQLIKLVDKYGEISNETTEDFGMDITGCIKAILIDDKHRAAFRDFTEDELKSRKVLWLYKDGLKISQADNTPDIRELALDIRHFAKQNNIPIVLFIPGVTTNSDVLDEIRGLPSKRMRLNIMKMQQAQEQELPEGDL